MIRPFHVRAVLALVCTVLAVSGWSCASDAKSAAKSGAGQTQPIRIRYFAYASGQNLELVNTAHTDATELYSTTRSLSDAGRKVSTDEVMDEVLKLFRNRGFYERAQAGAAPSTAEGTWSQSLEVETPGELVHMSLHKGSTADDRKLFFECAQAFVAIYNNTYQLQSVDRAPDWRAPPSPRHTSKSSSGGGR